MVKKEIKTEKSHFTNTHKKEINVFIGSRIKIVRLALGMTKFELATKIGITYQQLSNYENANSAITVDRLYKIARIFNTQITSLLPTRDDVEKMKI